MSYESYLTNDEYRYQVGATNRLENVVIRYVSIVSLSLSPSLSLSLPLSLARSHLFACNVLDVFTGLSLRLRADFQGHSP
jgi:hypothetical protein